MGSALAAKVDTDCCRHRSREGERGHRYLFASKLLSPNFGTAKAVTLWRCHFWSNVHPPKSSFLRHLFSFSSVQIQNVTKYKRSIYSICRINHKQEKSRLCLPALGFEPMTFQLSPLTFWLSASPSGCPLSGSHTSG